MFRKSLIIIGIILIILGIYCAVNPLASAVALGWLLGLVLALGGVSILVFSLKCEPKAILGILFGALLLISGLTTMSDSIGSFMAVNTLVSISNVFLLLSGISRIADAVRFKNYDASWKWVLVSGIITTVAAVILLSNPVSAVLLQEVILAVSFIFQGISLLSFGLIMPKM